MPIRNIDFIKHPHNVIRASRENEPSFTTMTGGSVFGKIGKWFKKAGKWVGKNVLAPVVEKTLPFVADKGLGKLASVVDAVPVFGDIMNLTGATGALKNLGTEQAKKLGKKAGRKLRGKGVGGATKRLTKKQIAEILN